MCQLNASSIDVGKLHRAWPKWLTKSSTICPVLYMLHSPGEGCWAALPVVAHTVNTTLWRHSLFPGLSVCTWMQFKCSVCRASPNLPALQSCQNFAYNNHLPSLPSGNLSGKWAAGYCENLSQFHLHAAGHSSKSYIWKLAVVSSGVLYMQRPASGCSGGSFRVIITHSSPKFQCNNKHRLVLFMWIEGLIPHGLCICRGKQARWTC